MTTYDVARYLAIDSVTAPAITPDGQLLAVSDTTGTPQVWTVPEAGAWPVRLTPYEERVSTVAASPTNESFVFGMDRGSDERDQLFHYDLATGVETRLTDDPESKHAFGAWFPDGDRVAFTANRDEAGRFDVYTTRVPDGDPERVTRGPGGWIHVASVGPDGRRLALLTPNASFDVDLSILDLETGEQRRLSDDEPATYADPAFDGDGGVYVVTNHGADTAYVGRFDLETGSLTPVAGHEDSLGEPGTDAWNADSFAYHRETGRAVYTRNVGGYSDLRAGRLDGTTFHPRNAPDVDGIVSDLTFGPDGDRLAVTHTASDEPYGVRVAPWNGESGLVGEGTVDVGGSDDGASPDESGGLGSLTPWTPVGTCGIPADVFQSPETIHYETFDGRQIPAYWTLPAGADESEPVPVIVDIHGGPEHQRRPWFYPVKQFFLNRGYAVLEPNVRGSSGYGKRYSHLDDVERRMDSVADIEKAVEWVADQPAADADRVVAYGRSYGGFMVLAAITEYPDLWAAAVEFVGIADFTTFLENTGEWRRSHREAEYGSLEDDYELLKEISPLSKIDRVDCPLFVQHGANDPRVPVGEARQVVDRAREAGVPVESLIFEDEGHHTTSRANKIEEFERIAAFLAEHVQ
ncbi:MAG: prolyl oligopeptidase family serine peptidase [Halobaculum sp.]